MENGSSGITDRVKIVTIFFFCDAGENVKFPLMLHKTDIFLR